MARRPGLRTPQERDPLDFGPYTVDQADTYYQGPHRSTRVQAHQFIPINDDDEPDENMPILNSKLFAYWLTRGYIYVRFWKKGTLVRYGPCTLQDYRTFREASSKGQSVRMLEGFGFEYVGKGPGVEI